MNDLQDLKKRISEIVSDLNAGQVETVTHTYSGGYRETSGGGYWLDGEETWETEEFVPDESKRSKGRQDLETLVKNTEPALLVQVPEPVVLDKVGEVYGADATLHYIHAFTGQKVDALRDALVKFGDERALPVLRDASSIDGYVSVFTRLNGGNPLVEQLVSGKIQPDDFRKNVARYIRTHLKVISTGFETIYQILRVLTDPQYWNRDFNDFRISLMAREEDSSLIKEIFDHPAGADNWKLYRNHNSEFNRERDELFRRMNARPFFQKVIQQDGYEDHLRVYAADMLGDEELLISMMDSPNCRIVAKALAKRYGPNHQHVVKSFLSHWQSIDDEDFKHCVVGIDDKIDELTTELVNPNTPRELKEKIWGALSSYPGVVERCHDDIRRIADYYVREGHQEGVFDQLFSEHYFSYDCMHTFYAIARNPHETSEIRTRALEYMGRFKGFFNKWSKKSHQEVWKYLKGASSTFFGGFTEPDPQIREVAKRVYVQVK